MVNQLISKRLNGIGEYYFSRKLRQIEELKSEGHDVLNLGIGSPDLKPPKEVEKALILALEDSNSHQYQNYKGLPTLRQAFSDWYHTHFDVSLDADSEILPLIGSKEGIMHTCMALLNEGDKVLVPNPGYPSYAAASKIAGAKIVHYALNEANDYLPDLDRLSEIDDVKLMWVNYPHMPTGKSGNEKLFDDLLAYSREKGVIIVNDNPYGFILTQERHSLLENRVGTDLVLELNSLSKSHNMAGWRVGVVSGNAQLIQSILTFKSNMDSGQFKPIMRAATEALKVSRAWYEQLNTIYEERKRHVLAIAKSLACEVKSDQVGMFVWAKIPSNYTHAESFADDLLDQYRIFVPPGSVFGSEGHQYIRFSLCSDIPVWKEVIKRIK